MKSSWQETLSQDLLDEIHDDYTIAQQHKPLRTLVMESLETYFKNLDDQEPAHLYDLIMTESEAGLLQVIMQRCHDNQSQAARWLGIARGTLRKKLKTLKIAHRDDKG